MPASLLTAVADVPLALIGIPAWMIVLAHSIVLLFQYPIHPERIDRLPWPVEFVFNTPSHHCVHHGANNPYLDKNYGGILIVWDRMSGSYAAETELVRYGLTTLGPRSGPGRTHRAATADGPFTDRTGPPRGACSSASHRPS
ncbi:sterol desaturase family protein [Streptomyces libani]|nr:sterol desaturase family protein [Streptomyces libani]